MFNVRSLILCIIVLKILFPSLSLFAEEPNYPKQSEYSSQIDECIQSEKWNYVTDEYACAGNSPYTRAYQVVISAMMAKVDKEKVLPNIKKLYENRSKDVAQWANSISDLFDAPPRDKERIYGAYMEICEKKATEEVFKHFGWQPTDDMITNTVVGNINGAISGNIKSCQQLAEKKLSAFKKIAWIIANKNIGKSFSTDRDTFARQVKDKFAVLENAFLRYKNDLMKIGKNINTFFQNVSSGP